MKHLLKTLRKNTWYIILLLASSLYVWYYRFDLYQLNEINTQYIIFILWLLLLAFPLFSEMEFLGVKVKKEVDKATKDVKDSLQTLQTQVSQIQLTNSFANNINFSTYPLPSEQKIDDLIKQVKELQSTYASTNNGSNDISTTEILNETENQNVYLFKIRLNIETSLRELCEKIGYPERRSIPRMVQGLKRSEVINGITCDIISQIINIANRGVHGEIVSAEYIKFVQETYPEIARQLKEASIKNPCITWNDF